MDREVRRNGIRSDTIVMREFRQRFTKITASTEAPNAVASTSRITRRPGDNPQLLSKNRTAA